MLLFINLLKEHNITKIKVPILQVLSYRYHELLSEREKENFPKKWNSDALEDLKYLSESRKKYRLKEYKHSLKWYNHIVDKQDVISKLKTENLINLFYRMTNHIPDLKIRNDIDIQGDYLDISIGNDKRIKF